MLLLVLALILVAHPVQGVEPAALKYRPALTREAQYVYGLTAPIPMFAGQIRQESSWRENVTAWDNGRGLAQFMDGTTAQVTKTFPELGPANPYNPQWAIRAMLRYDRWLYDRVQGDTSCEKWGAALKSYNAGLGYVQRAQKKSDAPGTWFGHTEYLQTGQSAQNFEYSRLYPRKILFKHQLLYRDWGSLQCLP